MKWWLDVPSAATGKYWAVLVQQHERPADWPAALERVPEDRRAAAESYLRDIARRMRNARNASRDGSHTP